ncbi:MAG: amino acid adenylation domain-containing protein [Oscillatoriophycideae cyanobacterium NC_groundwater_1537_Pr4_S-0.65um_50_18]|nr:amino acid adenylation domain-containing protein [Oscillatoriophycideae cyanobacterium NC_groundwater_1537_Pr4_S-0.65um_50_18]
MNEFSQRIAALSPEQQALLKQRLQQKQALQPQTSSIQKRKVAHQWSSSAEQDSNIPVSFAQQRTWFQDQLGVNSAISNNISIALQIKGLLKVTALEQSIREIIQRHEILRTTLRSTNGELTQVISPLGEWMLPVVDLCDRPTVESAAEVQRLATEQACEPFNLERDGSLRAKLLQISADEFVLLLTLHHIAVDAWSIGVFFRELSTLYGVFSNHQPSSLPELPIQYADFAMWQRQTLQGQALETDLTYWKQKLRNAPEVLQLPSDRARPPIQSFAGRTLSFLLPQPLTASLKQVSQQSGTTLFMTLVAGLQTLLFRYTGQDDILIGSPIANRQQPEIEPLMGCFINTLVLRTDLSGNPPFEELLQRVRETVLEALAHQNLPFEKLVDELQLARSLTHAPLFQVMLVLQNSFSIQNIELPGLTVHHSRIDNPTAQFDLTFHLVESEMGLIGKLEYNTDLFDESTITRLLGHFQTLLAGIVAHPDRCLAELPMLTLAEQQQLLTWNQTEANYSDRICIHHLFEAQVEKTPNAIAVISDHEQITYQELNHRANQLARYLQTLGVQAESLVGLCVERSIAMIVGLLGILKAGGAYVPLDPTYPPQRLEFILSDAQVSVLLTQTSLQTKFSELETCVVLLDTDWEHIAQEQQENLHPSVQANSLAYVIYTSGSTGQPKGVMVEHLSLVNYTEAAIQEYNISAGDRILQFASISFDAAAEEIFPSLTQGAALILRTEQMLSSMAIFLQTCGEWQLTVLDLPTAFWHQLVSEMVTLELTLPESIRLVILGGEKVLGDRVLLWQKYVHSNVRLVNVRLVNSYGPTEATIVTTTADLSQLTPTQQAGRSLPIGKPVRNAKTYVLDPFLQPVPVGVPGELYIGGLGVARSYLNRPDLTAQAFISDPFSQVSGARLYKTGDRVRYQADGAIEFLGRMDNQVKVRGFRIELGEIEALLSEHPDVQESVVIARSDEWGEKQLIAYLVPRASSAPTSANLRRFLEKTLPKYMVPSAFIVLEMLPLNANGKVDRQALPIPESIRPELESAYVAPRTATEAEIAKIFANILQIDDVGVEDDFFELGGHSLLITKLIAQLSPKFQVDLSIVDLFEMPTVAGLAEHIEKRRTLPTLLAQERSPLSLKMRHGERSPEMPVPLTFSQQYIWEIHHSSSTGAPLNSSLILRVKASLIPEIVEQSFNEIVRRHEILRTLFKIVNGQPMQMVLPALHLPLTYTDLQSLPPDQQESAALNQAIHIAQPPFDLAIAPLIRTALFRLTTEEHWLLITLHHIITDGWSFGLLVQELHTLIQSFSSGMASPLPAVSFHYADFALWQQQAYNEVAIAQQLAYWQHKLVDIEPLESPDLLILPLIDRQANHYSIHLSESLTSSIESLSRSLGVTHFVVLLAALNVALSAWSGQREIWMVTTVGNRTVPETEGMLGCFINDVILRSTLQPEQTGIAFIKQLQADIKEAIAHKDIPIERVIEHLKRFRPVQFMASVTLISSAQEVQLIPGWEVVDVLANQQSWTDIPSELYADDTPLEFYLELSTTVQIMVNYSTQKFTAEMIEQLLACYEEVLQQFVIQPKAALC